MATLKQYKLPLKKQYKYKQISFVVLLALQICFFWYFTERTLHASTKSWKTERTQRPSSKRNNSLNITIDMVNEYYPLVDFRFVFPEVSPKVKAASNIFMIILVNSGARGKTFRKHREVIRRTWGKRNNCEQRQLMRNETINHLRWLLVFVVGKAGQGSNDDELNLAEARQQNDMLIGNIEDNYINNIIKLYMGHVWASRFDIKYTLKTDDDVYVRIPRVLNISQMPNFQNHFTEVR